MPLFKIDKTLITIKEKPFELEKEMQILTEANLQYIFNLDFVKTEFALKKFRIDTLAFDRISKSFVIIEYKRDKNFSVIDQGYAYLSLMLNNKADFILEYNENKNSTLMRSDIDWSQSRVMFVAPSFTSYQREAINFKDLPIELWEVKRYANDTVFYDQIQNTGAQESIKTISPSNSSIDEVIQEVKVYTEDDHLAYAGEAIKELYFRFKEAIINLGDIDVKPNKLYMAFIAGSNIVDIKLQKKALKMWVNLNKGQLDDPKKIMRDVSTTGHHGNGDYEISLNSDDNLEYILSLIKQSYKKNTK